ncbi:LamG-like jellyroll fold domain-containing protein [Actinoplanes sp. NPDC024001]|uniref:LamG-like jellyroll fold domain-containing protein n=1 Tax=Actinoplanes sp. NPDC024001 TaxID=3154598 RepID=UPI0033EB60AB
MTPIPLRRLVVPGLLLLLLTGSFATRTRAVWVPAPPLRYVAQYTFDGTAPWADASGRGHTLTPVIGGNATVIRTPHDRGQAVRFPPRCARGRPCPRLVLRAASTPTLNPGARPLRYGAAVRLAPNRTSKGQNVLQKGYSTEGSQYKLQIDGRSGHPSCALVAGPAIHLALARISVADDRWHTLECRRAGTGLAVLVDGVTQGSTTVAAGLAVSNGHPLSIGGKSAYGDNDQYHGLLDDVWVAVG